MPTYDYTCQACGHKMEALQKITDAPLKECPACCQERLVRGVGGGIGLSITGDGFYKTMYGPKASSSDSNPDSGAGCCPCGKNKKDCGS